MRKYDWGQQQSKWKCKFHIRFPREKLEEGKRSVIYYSTYLISSPPSVVAMIQHYPSQGKKWNKGPAIYSSSRVWNINSLSPENCWCSTTEGISNQALRVTQSPEPTTSTKFIMLLLLCQKLWWKRCSKNLWGLAKFFSATLATPININHILQLWLLELSGSGMVDVHGTQLLVSNLPDQF